ncbi:putative bifunctional diguanylate cyclase/phosphodiesterase [Arthrobacter roseus]|uniref:putative bifunctional diguanylate cyclase/phosphodiesterase n=1 Tax=Arthrobacter roseus TaxID=136274 RepID=UPI001964B202|nr:bifunctional diguanylate cyclase/phosphodiesterase [Arthrobacter roseus]MBM7848922.1 diguanylate cyclase (GGDEF)-like protein [Arthrobacter roseus]
MSSDPRLANLVDWIVGVSRGDLRHQMSPSDARDDVDAVITGVNLLVEELDLVYQQFEDRVEQRTAELHEAHLQMQKMAMTDPLTGLANRVALVTEIDKALTSFANGSATAPALLLLDLDSFKNVNDSLGHDAGDQVLKIVAERLREAVRLTDVVARLGGDEFAILIPDATMGIAQGIANRALDALSAHIELEDLKLWARASIGLRLADKDQSSYSLLLDADTAMYTAKDQGRSRLSVFEPVMLYARQVRNQTAAELREAIASDQLDIHYQPVVDLRDGHIQGVEALVRWNHPTRGLVMPDDFVPVAEEIGAIVDLDRWVMTAALRQFQDWRTRFDLDEDFQLRINVSAIDLQQLDLIDFVRGALKQNAIPPRNVVLEITETALITGADVERYSLLSLQKLGVCIEIDDFGTGYSSISYLRKLPVSMVKVDRTLVAELADGAKQNAFVAAILQLIRAAGLDAVFEGIESCEQAAQLRDMGCISGQGYFFSRPLPLAHIEELLVPGVVLPLSLVPHP